MRQKSGKKVWECSRGCKSGTLCRHLEALLPPVGGPDSKKLVYSNRVYASDSASSPEEEYLKHEAATLTQIEEPDDRLVDEETQLREKLKCHGLAKRKIEVVVDRIIHGLTFQEIAVDRAYSSAPAAHAAYTNAIAFLKQVVPQPKGKK